MNKRTLTSAILGAALFGASSLFAYGPHTALDCLGCHDPHYAKAQKIFKVKNELMVNPRTGQKIDDVSALCLGCHNTPQFGGAGIRPIHLHMTHPVNVVPNTKIANVPHKLLRKDMIQCVSCHDPHPSNPNWRYLRVDTEGGTKVGRFCEMCHPAKADTAFYGVTQRELQVFTSMNEAVGPGNYSPWDDGFTAANPTPVYIQPYGEFPNSIAPAYPVVAGMDWIFAPPEDKIPDELKKSLAGQELTPNEAQKAQQEWNKNTKYAEPEVTKGPDADKQRGGAPKEKPAPAAKPAAQPATGGTQNSGNAEGNQGGNTAEPQPAAAPAQ